MKIYSNAFGDESWIIDSQQEGPVVTIFGGVHGNETCGVEALHWLIDVCISQPDFFTKGTIHCVLGNPRAIMAKKRFVDFDLNRLYGAIPSKVHQLDSCYEIQRSEVLKKALQGSSTFLDIHSGHTPMPPMTCSAATPAHLQLCAALPVGYITTGWTGKTVGLAGDEYADQLGAVGVTLECGQHIDPESVSIAKKAICSFLTHMGMRDDNLTQNKPKHVHITETVYASTDDFQFKIPSLKSFSIVPKGALVATDGGENILATEDFVLVMPDPRVRKGHEAFYKGIFKS